MTTLGPDDYQDKDDPAARAARRHEEEIAAGILAALSDFRQSLDLDAIAAALQAGNLAGVMAQLPYRELDAGLDDAAAPLAATYAEAGAAEASNVTVLTPGSAASNVIRLPFDPQATAGLTDLELYRRELLGEISQSTEDGITQAVRAAVRQHVGLDGIARAIKDAVGLTPRQAQAVANYRRMLEGGDPGALQRALRDARFDATTRRLVAGEDVGDAKIDRMVERYAERQLAYRARMIAQAEAQRVANAGVRQVYAQGVTRGLFTSGQVRRHWLIALSEGTCALCLSIPILNPLGVGLEEMFMSIEGPVSEPVADTHPWCRCSLRYRIAANALAVAA